MSLRVAALVVLILTGSAAPQSLTFSPPFILKQISGGQAETVFVFVTNNSAATVGVTQIIGIKSTQVGFDWLGVEPVSLSIPAGATDSIAVIVNKGGLFGSPSTLVELNGNILFVTDLPSPEDSLRVFLQCSAGGTIWPTCCVGTRGNIDGDPADNVDIGDVTALIDNLFIAFTPFYCWQEADCDGNGNIDIGDLTCWIDCLFVSFCPVLPDCPR